MDAQKIYLSPLNILSYLCDLEKKIPNRTPQEYVSNATCFQSDNDLNVEAKKMLEFVGLKRCEPNCTFETTHENIAGTTLNNNSLQSINISVSTTYVGNTKACLAILAHEICHKLIYLNGIDFPSLPIYTEIFTDLCTIYVGFGKLVVDGYITKSKDNDKNGGEITHFLGYLKYDMYLHALYIVYLCRGGYKNIPEIYIDDDQLLQDAVYKWKSIPNVRDYLRSRFMAEEKALSEVLRNMLLIPQIFEQVFTKHKSAFIEKSDVHKTLGTFSGDENYRSLQKFKAIYESIIKETALIECNEVSQSLDNLILTLTDKYEDIDLSALNYEKFKCPCCGKITSINGIIDRDTIIKCKSCGVYFRFCNSYLNITKLRQERQRQKEREEARQKENYRKAFNDGYFKTNDKYKKIIENLPWWVKLFAGSRFPKNL